MKANFDHCLAHVLQHEGGWADHPRDPGGATMRGVTQATFSAFKGRQTTKDELRNISDADLGAIYRQGYWDKMRCDDMPAGLDLVAFDAAVNSGPRRAAQWLQQAAGVAQDGSIGPKTLAAVASADPVRLIEAALRARLQFLKGLSTFSVFGKGWTARVQAVQVEALAMVNTIPATSPSWLAALIAAIIALFRKGQ